MQDFFRGRVLFPICDPSGRPVALGGRILPARPGQAPPDRPEPKYKNSQESPIYSKRRTLYALNWAKKGVIAQGEVVVCEGYTDVIGSFQAGVPWAVATCGTALAEEHFTLLRNFAKRIVLAYDADAAGQSATSRVYEWERKHEVDVVVADLPGGSDPGELARTDPTALARAIKEARPFLQFRVDRMLNAGDLTTAEGRARAAEAALTAVAEHPDDLVRDQYVMQLADRCRVDSAKLRERLEYLRAHPPAEKPARRTRGSQDEPPPRDYPEDDGDVMGHDGGGSGTNLTTALRPGPGLEALKLAVHRPEDVVDRVHAVLFTDRVQRQAFVALLEHDSVHEAVESASPEVASLLRRVIVEEPMSGDPDLGDPVDSVVVVMLRDAARRALGDIEIESRVSDDSWQGSGGVGIRPGATLAGRTRRIRFWARRGRPVGSVVDSEGTRGDEWQVEGERRVSGGYRRRGSRAVPTRPRRRWRRSRTSPFRLACRKVTSTRPSSAGRAKGQLTQAELIEALHTVELTPEVLTTLIDRVTAEGVALVRTKKRTSSLR